jgi:alpha-beta hydrolase superfamily lysophospholipase
MNYQTQILTFTTAHNERLHGALLTPPNKKSDTALIFVHGVAMNFYLPPLFNFGQELSQRGHHSFIINTRGHDWISRAGNLSKFGGSAYENLEDCLPDLDGAFDYLQQQGYRRFVLIGHSLGAIKSIIYQGTRQRAEVVGIVSCSAPKQFYSERIARQPQFRELIEQAEAMVAEGRGEELMSISVGATPGIFSARSHLNKYGKDDRNDCRPYAKLIAVRCSPSSAAPSPSFSTNTRRKSPRARRRTALASWSTAPIIFTTATRRKSSRSYISGLGNSPIEM